MWCLFSVDSWILSQELYFPSPERGVQIPESELLELLVASRPLELRLAAGAL